MHPVLEYLSNVNNNYNREYEEDLYDESIATSSILSTFPGVNITRVTTVHNNYLHGMYELKKLEYESRYGSVQELTLVHSTSARNVQSIIEDNLDWRRVVRGKYGDGVSFSGSAGYANRFSNRNNGYERAFIVATVLVSREMELDGYTSMEVPPDDVDTTTGNDGQVYVKYCDNEFLIKYIVYYRYQL
ncbi:uncharacterized protein LOC128988507 [Macrosteles quadrilineatus]|uniref:uncharacterized protein LOC128988507 n=1 Tax=Macrosteles quadrilineatus TaxID=74068 RepID=UPI0023E1F99C|nr:uncharacterized protein LOC128988507 [Macrosteles quadrilineatus]XP_054265841.1 uncharacterized protein LOC128988507 [Macrosteles quadrilineatus]XP_054265842.1 uncharacterized protein LOC128988507 [Macrosteles quadrilineatus]